MSCVSSNTNDELPRRTEWCCDELMLFSSALLLLVQDHLQQSPSLSACEQLCLR